MNVKLLNDWLAHYRIYGMPGIVVWRRDPETGEYFEPKVQDAERRLNALLLGAGNPPIHLIKDGEGYVAVTESP